MKYIVYETIIESFMPLLNLPEYTGSETIDARIISVNSPSDSIPPGEHGTYYSPRISAIGMSHGTIEVCNGTEIKVYLAEGATPHDISLYIVGWGFAFLFSQRGNSIFHCTALNINDRGVIISGVSGSGKSSTALSLIKSGARYLADDVAIINREDVATLIPAYPIQKVCRDVSVSLDSNLLLHISEERDKFSYYNINDYCDKPVKLSYFFLIKVHDEDDLLFEELSGLDKWLKILECLYLNSLFVLSETPSEDKTCCLKLAGLSRVFLITRPSGMNTLDEITERILKVINE